MIYSFNFSNNILYCGFGVALQFQICNSRACENKWKAQGLRYIRKQLVASDVSNIRSLFPCKRIPH